MLFEPDPCGMELVGPRGWFLKPLKALMKLVAQLGAANQQPLLAQPNLFNAHGT